MGAGDPFRYRKGREKLPAWYDKKTVLYASDVDLRQHKFRMCQFNLWTIPIAVVGTSKARICSTHTCAHGIIMLRQEWTLRETSK